MAWEILVLTRVFFGDPYENICIAEMQSIVHLTGSVGGTGNVTRTMLISLPVTRSLMNVPGTPDKERILPLIMASVIIIGMVVLVVLLISGQDSFTALYIVPGSVVSNQSGGSVFFSYGVRCQEPGGSSYTLDFSSDGIPIRSKQFSLKKGETLEEGIQLDLPAGRVSPSKISLILRNPTGTEEVHFWTG